MTEKLILNLKKYKTDQDGKTHKTTATFVSSDKKELARMLKLAGIVDMVSGDDETSDVVPVDNTHLPVVVDEPMDSLDDNSDIDDSDDEELASVQDYDTFDNGDDEVDESNTDDDDLVQNKLNENCMSYTLSEDGVTVHCSEANKDAIIPEPYASRLINAIHKLETKNDTDALQKLLHTSFNAFKEDDVEEDAVYDYGHKEENGIRQRTEYDVKGYPFKGKADADERLTSARYGANALAKVKEQSTSTGSSSFRKTMNLVKEAYGEKTDHKKIDIYTKDGKYLASTNWAENCKEAVDRYAEKHNMDSSMLKACFAESMNEAEGSLDDVVADSISQFYDRLLEKYPDAEITKYTEDGCEITIPEEMGGIVQDYVNHDMNQHGSTFLDDNEKTITTLVMDNFGETVIELTVTKKDNMDEEVECDACTYSWKPTVHDDEDSSHSDITICKTNSNGDVIDSVELKGEKAEDFYIDVSGISGDSKEAQQHMAKYFGDTLGESTLMADYKNFLAENFASDDVSYSYGAVGDSVILAMDKNGVPFKTKHLQGEDAANFLNEIRNTSDLPNGSVYKSSDEARQRLISDYFDDIPE